VVVALLAAFIFHTRSSSHTGTVRSIAVLPIVNGTQDTTQEYLSDGITEGVINNLAQLPSLRVLARSTVFRFKDHQDDPLKIGHDLNVDAVLTGKMSRGGGGMTIQADLVSVQDGSELWGQQFNFSEQELASAQAQIAQQISEKLRLKLTPSETRQLAKTSTQNTGAYQAYLRGRFGYNRRTADSLRQALASFQEAVARDPNYAPAYAGLADTYNVVSDYGLLPPQDAIPKAEAAARKALALDDSLAEPHAALGQILADYNYDWAGAEREFRRAIELNPNYAEGRYFFALVCLVPQGRYEEAIAQMKKAIEGDPLSLIVNSNLILVYRFAHQDDMAMEQAQNTLKIDPDFPVLHMRLEEIYEQKGMYEMAIGEIEKRQRVTKEMAPLLRLAFAKSGARGYWQEMLRLQTELATKEYVTPSSFAFYHVCLGEKDRAMDWLEKAHAEHDVDLTWVLPDPTLDPLRTEPRFKALLKSIGLAH
jgi:adenylate cyclase